MTQQHTLYDAEITRLQSLRHGQRLHREVARREGYLRAKAEDADLLAVLEGIVEEGGCETPDCLCVGGTEETCTVGTAIAAIAKARGEA